MTLVTKKYTLFNFCIIHCACCLIWSCQKSDATTIGIDPAFVDFIEIFELEANQRSFGLNILDSQLSIYFTELEDDVIGTCQYNGDGIIAIDTEYWQQATYYEKESLLFHEFGHCILGRTHLNDNNERGICQSIMNSGTGECDFDYNNRNRSTLIDELFQVE